jgi:hypothetical protein
MLQDFETCVLQGDRECRYVEGESHEGIGDHRRQSLFFCGHSDFCTYVKNHEFVKELKFSDCGAVIETSFGCEK